MNRILAFWWRYVVRPRCDIKAHLGLEPKFPHYWMAYTRYGPRCGLPAAACVDVQVVGHSYLCLKHAESLAYETVFRGDVAFPELRAA